MKDFAAVYTGIREAIDAYGDKNPELTGNIGNTMDRYDDETDHDAIARFYHDVIQALA